MEANKDTSSLSAGHETVEVMDDSQGEKVEGKFCVSPAPGLVDDDPDREVLDFDKDKTPEVAIIPEGSTEEPQGVVSDPSDHQQEENQVIIEIDIEKNKMLSQNIVLTDNGEKLFAQFNTNRVGEHKMESQLNLADYIPQGTVIRPGDLTIKRAFTPNGGSIILDINYKHQ